MKAVAEIQVVPIGAGVSVRPQVRRAQELIRASGLVVQERQGRETVSRVDYPEMRALAAFLVEECCTGVRIERAEAAV